MPNLANRKENNTQNCSKRKISTASIGFTKNKTNTHTHSHVYKEEIKMGDGGVDLLDHSEKKKKRMRNGWEEN